jgi:hypothetical protein
MCQQERGGMSEWVNEWINMTMHVMAPVTVMLWHKKSHLACALPGPPHIRSDRIDFWHHDWYCSLFFFLWIVVFSCRNNNILSCSYGTWWLEYVVSIVISDLPAQAQLKSPGSGRLGRAQAWSERRLGPSPGWGPSSGSGQGSEPASDLQQSQSQIQEYGVEFVTAGFVERLVLDWTICVRGFPQWGSGLHCYCPSTTSDQCFIHKEAMLSLQQYSLGWLCSVNPILQSMSNPPAQASSPHFPCCVTQILAALHQTHSTYGKATWADKSSNCTVVWVLEHCSPASSVFDIVELTLCLYWIVFVTVQVLEPMHGSESYIYMNVHNTLNPTVFDLWITLAHYSMQCINQENNPNKLLSYNIKWMNEYTSSLSKNS